MVVAFIRYLQLRAILNSSVYPQLMTTAGHEQAQEKAHIQKLNLWALLVAVVMALSCCATGAFRFAESFVLHGLCASGIFSMTPLYVVVQTYLSKKLSNRVATAKVIKFRFFCVGVMLFFVALFVTSLPISYFAVGDPLDYHEPVDRIFLSPTQAGYVEHLVNAIAEWGFLLSISPYILTFAYDFRRITFRGLQLDYHFIY